MNEEIKDIEKIAELKYPYNERNQFGELMTAPVGQNPPNYKKYERLRNAFIEGVKYAASLPTDQSRDWISVKDRLPKESDGDERGYVMVFLRIDRQWGWPTRVGFGKWNRVSYRSHTHWMLTPNKPTTITPQP